MNCSELKHHLYINHVAETPNCLCGCIETPQHYFWMSIIFYSQRHFTSIFSKYCLIKNIHYGDIQENMTKNVITAVEKYISETQRFFILALPCCFHINVTNTLCSETNALTIYLV